MAVIDNRLEIGFNVYVEVLHALKNLFVIRKSVSAEEFSAFVRPFIVRHPGIQALEWIPRVLAMQRSQFISSARAAGMTNFTITQRAQSGKLVPATEREEYYPVHYIEPLEGNTAALGFAEESGVPFDLGIIRNHYVGRTFIEPGEQIRHLGVKLKHNANRAVVAGRRVVLVDDSIVRGTTSVKIVEMMRNAGAKEVHMRVASPPTAHSCFYGVDTPERSKLLAAQRDIEGMREFIGVDSLSFLSFDGLYRAMGKGNRNAESPQYCDACFTGDYPIPLTDHDGGETSRQLSLLAEGA